MPLIDKSRQQIRSASRKVVILWLLFSTCNILQVQANPAEFLEETVITANKCNQDRQQRDVSVLAFSTITINSLRLRNFPELKTVPDNAGLPNTGRAKPGLCGGVK
jgi:hypothetical protein